MDRLEEKKQEASIPVQSRIDIRLLAEMLVYWDDQGVVIKNMSMLVSWSMEILKKILVENRYVGEIDSIATAHSILTDRGLYQASMKARTMKKLNTAMGFENLRLEGVNPKDYVAAQYKTIHNKRSVSVYGEDIDAMVQDYNKREIADNSRKSDGHSDEIEALLGKTDEEFEGPSGTVDDEYLEKQKVNDMTAKSSNIIMRKKTESELDAEGERIRKKDAERRKLEEAM